MDDDNADDHGNIAVHDRIADDRIDDGTIADERTPDERISGERVVDGKVADDRIADDGIADGMVSDKRITDERFAHGKLDDESISDERVADERISDERITNEKIASERISSERVASERIASERIASERIASERIASERIASERTARERTAREMIANERISKGEIADDKVFNERTGGGSVGNVKIADERIASERMDSSRRVRRERATNAEIHSARVRRYLSGSIYLWPCGEKAESEDEELTVSDGLIGWLTLLLQGLAYAVLIARAGTNSDEDSEDSAGYSLASITGAMYLLVASTTPDLRAGFSLLVDGFRIRHRVFGTGLLLVYGLMISAAMQVLFSSAEDDASVVTNAVTVLFIADVDEKALHFFLTVPQKWRLFWAIFTVGISFALALVGVMYVGNLEDLYDLDADTSRFETDAPYSDILDGEVPSWFVCIVNPGAVTLFSFFLSNALRSFSEACSRACKNASVLTFTILKKMFASGVRKAATIMRELVGREPCFHALLGLWLMEGVVNWWVLVREYGFALAISYVSTTGGGLETTEHAVAFIFANSALAAGLVLKAICFCLPKREQLTAIPEPLRSSGGSRGRGKCGSLRYSRVPSLLVGWGCGYWITSVLYLLGGSWDEGGWDGAPLVVSIVGYVVIPSFFLASIFMMADVDFLGDAFGEAIKPALDVLRNRRGVWYWVLVTVLRDVLLLWGYFWFYLIIIINAL